MKTAMKDIEVGDRIKNLRLDKGYSREKLAELAGISSKFLYEIENKHVGFSAETLCGLSCALDVSSDYILYGRSSMEYEERIAKEIAKFEPNTLVKVENLLKIAYDLAHN